MPELLHQLKFEIFTLTKKQENILMIFIAIDYLPKGSMILFLNQENLISRFSSIPMHLPLFVLRKEI